MDSCPVSPSLSVIFSVSPSLSVIFFEHTKTTGGREREELTSGTADRGVIRSQLFVPGTCDVGHPDTHPQEDLDNEGDAQTVAVVTAVAVGEEDSEEGHRPLM